MKVERLGTWFGVIGAVLLAVPAAGQEPDRRRPDREGRGGGGGLGERMRDPRMMMQGRGQESAPAMVVSAGKLYIVLGRELRRLDADTLEEEKKADIPVPGANDEAGKKKQKKFIARFDKNKDGAIGKDEFPRADIIQKLDKNGDGKITVEEAPGAQMMAARMPAGPSTLLVERGSVYVFQGGSLYRFNADSLELQATAELAPQRPGGMPGGMKGGMRGGMKGGREGGDRGRPDKRDRGGPRGEPEVPEDPVRF